MDSNAAYDCGCGMPESGAGGPDSSAACVPGHLAAHVERWLVSNQKEPDEVRWGQFPLGMVQRWVERAEEAEAKLATLAEAKRVMEGLSFGYEPTEADHEEAAFPWA